MGLLQAVCNAQAAKHVSNQGSALLSPPPTTNCSGNALVLRVSLESNGDLKQCFLLLKEPFLFTVEYS